ncbi:unnamed protein product [Ixodes pacificus]
MEDVKQFGDPDKLISEENLIVLKLDRPWSQPLPYKLTIDSTCQLLSMDQEGFVSCVEFLGDQPISAALFADCPAFDFSTSFDKAAELILKNAHTLVVLHNRNLICDLYSKSTCLKSLVLFHNLRLQVENLSLWCSSRSKNFWCSTDPSGPSQLVKLVGTMPALGMNSLSIHSLVLVKATSDCPMLTYIQAPMDHFFSERVPDGSSSLANLGISTEHLILGVRVKALNGTIYQRGEVTASCLARARRACPHVQDLEVVTTSPESLLEIAEFDRMRCLSITANFEKCTFHQFISPLLKKFDVSRLALTNVKRIKLSQIACFCENISSLSLVDCTLVDETSSLGFTELRRLHLERCHVGERLVQLLLGCRNLESLRLDFGNAGVFVALAPVLGLHKLRRLVLDTEEPLRSLGCGGGELPHLLKSLPSLKYLATDSYGIRLFFESNAPHVTLAWAHCTVCTAEFPKLSKAHEAMWHKFAALD